MDFPAMTVILAAYDDKDTAVMDKEERLLPLTS